MFATKVERLLPPRDRAWILRKTRAQWHEVPRPLEQESRSSEPGLCPVLATLSLSLGLGAADARWARSERLRSL